MPNFLISLMAHNGKYVCAEGGGGGSLVANRDEIGPWETFRLIHLSDRLDLRNVALVALQTHNGHYVRVEDGGRGLVVVANGNAIGSWETFRLTNIGYDDGASQFELILFAHQGGHICLADSSGDRLAIGQRSGYNSRDVFTGIVNDSLPGLNFLDSLFLKRIQDKYKQAKRVGSLESKVDELLAFKAEMVEKIENTVMFIEQNCFDRRLEDSILFLAGYGGDDNMGFNGSDARFGHDLATRLQNDENLTLKQAKVALGMMQKYRQSQLEPNGYSLPTAWEEISHQYRNRTIEGELPALSAVLKTGQHFLLATGEYCDTFIVIDYPDPEISEALSGCSEDRSNVFLDATPRLMDILAEYRGSGYATYVDPDIEAAYYLRQHTICGNRNNNAIANPFYPCMPYHQMPFS